MYMTTGTNLQPKKTKWSTYRRRCRKTCFPVSCLCDVCNPSCLSERLSLIAGPYSSLQYQLSRCQSPYPIQDAVEGSRDVIAYCPDPIPCLLLNEMELKSGVMWNCMSNVVHITQTRWWFAGMVGVGSVGPLISNSFHLRYNI